MPTLTRHLPLVLTTTGPSQNSQLRVTHGHCRWIFIEENLAENKTQSSLCWMDSTWARATGPSPEAAVGPASTVTLGMAAVAGLHPKGPAAGASRLPPGRGRLCMQAEAQGTMGSTFSRPQGSLQDCVPELGFISSPLPEPGMRKKPKADPPMAAGSNNIPLPQTA